MLSDEPTFLQTIQAAVLHAGGDLKCRAFAQTNEVPVEVDGVSGKDVASMAQARQHSEDCRLGHCTP